MSQTALTADGSTECGTATPGQLIGRTHLISPEKQVSSMMPVRFENWSVGSTDISLCLLDEDGLSHRSRIPSLRPVPEVIFIRRRQTGMSALLPRAGAQTCLSVLSQH